jgi:hypothetical protein
MAHTSHMLDKQGYMHATHTYVYAVGHTHTCALIYIKICNTILHGDNGYVNAPQGYVIRILPPWLRL